MEYITNRTSRLTIQDAKVEEYTWDFIVPPRSRMQQNIESVNFSGFIFSGLRFEKGFLGTVDHRWDLIFYANQINMYLALPSRDTTQNYTVHPSKLQLISGGEIKNTHPLNFSKCGESRPTTNNLWCNVWINKDGSWNDEVDHVRIIFKVSLEKTGVVTISDTPSAGVKTDILNAVKAIDSSSYYLSDHLSDVTLECQGRLFPAHKILLSCKSRLFCKIFKAQKDPKKNVTIGDIDANVLAHVLRHMYYGQVDLTSMTTEFQLKMHEAAEKFGLKHLKIICEQELVQTITKRNCLEILNVGLAGGTGLLRERCVELLKSNVKEILGDRATFKTFCEKNPDLVHQIFTEFK